MSWAGREDLGDRAEPIRLQVHEGAVGLVGGGEMAHQTGQAFRPRPVDELFADTQRRLGVQPPASHAGVDLDVHVDIVEPTQALPGLGRADGDSDATDSGHTLLLSRRQRGQHQQRHIGQFKPDGTRLIECGGAELGRTARDRSEPGIDGAMTVRVGLDDGPDLSSTSRLKQPLDVRRDGSTVDLDQAALARGGYSDPPPNSNRSSAETT